MNSPSFPQASRPTICCGCKDGDCRSLSCPCFKKGAMCGPDCQCPKCANKREFQQDRLEQIENILLADPMSFTTEDTLTQEERSAILNFAMLTNSVDSEDIIVKPKVTSLTRLLSPQVLNLSIRTIMSAANEDLKKSPPSLVEERAENSVSSEFENVLTIILQRINPKADQPQ